MVARDVVSLVDLKVVADPGLVVVEAGSRRETIAPRLPWSFVLGAADLLSLTFTISLVCSLATGPNADARRALEAGPFVLLFMGTLALYGLYGKSLRRVGRAWSPVLGRLVHAVAVAGFASWGLGQVADRFVLGATPGSAAAMAVAALVAVPLGRGLASAAARRAGVPRARVAVVGSGLNTERLLCRLATLTDIEVVGLVDDGPDDVVFEVPRLGGTVDLVSICQRHEVDRVLVCSSAVQEPITEAAVRSLPSHVAVSIVPEYSQMLTWQSSVEDLRGMVVLDVPSRQDGAGARLAKRGLDLVGGLFLLVVSIPLLAAIALAVRLTSPGPVLFSQPRIGLGGRPFRVYKFRTMVPGADAVKIDLRSDADGPMFKMRDDPRVTSVGRLLRRTSLDELPQLLNVLNGTMSLVGPRPFVAEESDRFEGWTRRRFDVKPGMTGAWQVSGRSDLPFEELRQLDYAYASSWSLWWDLQLLWQTPAAVVRGRGAY
jgi:exopolysaccharide biosynthesis polyprenyl glycosylphosphotransferase